MNYYIKIISIAVGLYVGPYTLISLTLFHHDQV